MAHEVPDDALPDAAANDHGAESLPIKKAVAVPFAQTDQSAQPVPVKEAFSLANIFSNTPSQAFSRAL